MEPTSVIGMALLIITGLISYKGFRDSHFFEDYLFEVDKILIDREYKRLLSSGFLHANWIHFGFNMVALLSFSFSLEITLGYGKFLLLYFASLIGGNLLALWVHRHHGDYRAVGASGAISGVIFASIILFPDSTISFVIIPIKIKSWIFGLLFILISIFGIKSQKDNIGHEAHLGGAIVGVILTLFLAPSFWEINWWIVSAILVPATAFLILIVRNPAVLMIHNYWGENVRSVQSMTQKRTPGKSKQDELDELLDKIRKHGMESLNKKERKRLDELTNNL